MSEELQAIQTQLPTALSKCLDNWTGGALTVKDTLKATSIRRLKNIHGQKLILMSICGVLMEGLKQFNVHVTMDNDQVKFFGAGFMAKYEEESVADLAVCLTEMAFGTYGKIEYSIDGPKIMDCFKQHLESKAQAREQRNLEYKKQQSKPLGKLDEVGKRTLDAIRSRLSEEDNKARQERNKGKVVQEESLEDWFQGVKDNIEDFEPKQIELLINKLEGLSVNSDTYRSEINYLRKQLVK